MPATIATIAPMAQGLSIHGPTSLPRPTGSRAFGGSLRSSQPAPASDAMGMPRIISRTAICQR